MLIVSCPKCFAGLLVVSSKDDEPINRFVDLFNTNKLPSLLNDGAMDPKILKHYLLVHDNQDGASEKYATLSYLTMFEIIKCNKHDNNAVKHCSIMSEGHACLHRFNFLFFCFKLVEQCADIYFSYFSYLDM